MMDQQHLGWRRVQGELRETLPENASQGSSWGGCLKWSQGQVYGLEVILKETVSREQDEIRRICSMQAEAEPVREDPPTVLQTYTVPLAKVKTELQAWVPAIECRELREITKAVRAVCQDQLKHEPGFEGDGDGSWKAGGYGEGATWEKAS